MACGSVSSDFTMPNLQPALDGNIYFAVTIITRLQWAIHDVFHYMFVACQTNAKAKATQPHPSRTSTPLRHSRPHASVDSRTVTEYHDHQGDHRDHHDAQEPTRRQQRDHQETRRPPGDNREIRGRPPETKTTFTVLRRDSGVQPE